MLNDNVSGGGVLHVALGTAAGIAGAVARLKFPVRSPTYNICR